MIGRAFEQILENQVLWAALGTWFLAQVIKVPIDLARTRDVKWSLLFSPGGMPSSHAALVSSLATGVGMRNGYDSPLFAVAVALAMVVIYDAAGVRRAAGKQASILNVLIDELAQGHPLREEQLKEILGHSPVEVAVGIAFGVVVGWALMRI